MNKSNRFCIVFFITAVGYFSNSCKHEDPSPKLPEITTKDVTVSVTSTFAYGYSGGTITSTGGSRITASGICWSTQELPTISDSKFFTGKYSDNHSVFASVGTYSCQLLGLKRLTTYYIRAFATNSVGTAYGNQVSFTSPDLSWMSLFDISLSYPINEGVVTNTNPELKWMNITPLLSIRNISYDVYLDTNPNPTTKIAANLSSESLQLTGLIPGTKYYWKVFGWEATYPEDNTTSDIRCFYTATGSNVTSDRVSTVTERGVH